DFNVTGVQTCALPIYRFDYIARFGMADLVDSPMAQAVDSFLGDGTRIGGGDVEGAVRVVVDFAGGPLSDYPAEAPVAADATALEDLKRVEQGLGTARA